MRSINYADSVRQTTFRPRCFPCDASFLSCFLLFVRIILRISTSLFRTLPLPLFLSRSYALLRVGSPQSRNALARDANNAHFYSMAAHSLCNERSYCRYNAVTSACCCNCGAAVTVRPDSLFTTALCSCPLCGLSTGDSPSSRE